MDTARCTLVLLALLVGCARGMANGPPHPDTRPSDAGVRPDVTARPDAGSVDAYAAADAPPPDVGRPDASAPDAGVRDAGGRDAGTSCACAPTESCLAGACVPFPTCASSSACAPGSYCRSGVCVPGDRDLDGDGVTALTDCDEARAAVHPGAAEVCNGLDDDCNGVTDPPTASGASTYYRDADGDGYGGTATTACAMPAGHVARGGDCDDASALRTPGRAEVCNSIDDDCDGGADETGCPAGCFGALRGTASYFVCTTSRTWSSASSACTGRRAHLVRIDDNAENNWVRAQADARGLSSIWIGGSDATSEGRWVWADGTTRFWTGSASGSAYGGAFTRWASGEPNDDGGEDCLELGTDHTWNDDECDTSEGFVCEL